MARNIGDGATKEYSHKNVLYTKSCRRISSCFAKKDAFQNTDFSRFKYQFKRKNCHSVFLKIVQVSKCPSFAFSAAISCLNARSHWFLASTHSTFSLIGSCNRNLNTQSHADTYAHTTVSYFFKNSSKTNKLKQNTSYRLNINQTWSL